jgi:formylglycine-generating enzyme
MKSVNVAMGLVSAVLIGVCQAANIDLVTVANPGNAPDTAVMDLDGSTGYGSVGYIYQIGKYDVTNAQYAEFLNAKATNGDPLSLWNSQMSSEGSGGINRSGSGPYTYTVKPGQGNRPVVAVSWFDTLRFANWLNNGQGDADTESGSYTLLGGTPTPLNYLTIVRNPEAKWGLTTENEWYKAAYYDPNKGGMGIGGYWSYPTKSNTAPTWVLSTAAGPNGGINSANFYDSASGYALTGSTSYNSNQDYLTDVGAYPNSLSAYGTLDQCGDVWQWNEADVFPDHWSRGLRGGSAFQDTSYMQASHRNWPDGSTVEDISIGFRVAYVPEPSIITLLVAGAIGLLILSLRRRNGP